MQICLEIRYIIIILLKGLSFMKCWNKKKERKVSSSLERNFVCITHKTIFHIKRPFISCKLHLRALSPESERKGWARESRNETYFAHLDQWFSTWLVGDPQNCEAHTHFDDPKFTIILIPISKVLATQK